MKSILFLIPTLGGGGAEKVLVTLANNLDKSKYDVTIQTLFKPGVNERFINEDVKFVAGSFKQFSGNVLLLKIFSPSFLYKRIIKKRYDIVISYLESPTTRIVAGCPFPETKLISWIHTVLNKHRANYCFRSSAEAYRLQSKYNRIICVSQQVADSVNRIYNFKDKCRILYNTNDSEIITQLSKESIQSGLFSKEINIISVGRLIKEKAFDRLVKAHARLREEGFDHHVYILGCGYEEEKLKEMVSNYSVSSTFHFLGFDSNPYKYMAKANLFVCSSEREGFSTAVTEALILGVPVVSTDVSGATELLGENNEFGVVVENSEEGVYNGLREFLLTPSLIERYRKLAEERGRRFSKKNTVCAVEEMFESV